MKLSKNLFWEQGSKTMLLFFFIICNEIIFCFLNFETELIRESKNYKK